jgi:poly(3-hydroxybutyrate) depolymerase
MTKSLWSKSFFAIIAYFLLCMLSGCENSICMNPACAAELSAKGKTTVMKYKDREFRLYVPAALQKADKNAGKSPMIIALHGGLGNATIMEATSGLDRLADQKGFVVAYLNGTGGWMGQMKDKRTWNAGDCCGSAQKQNVDDVGYIAGFIKDMITKNPVDPSRIYLIGHSNGAMMSYRFVCEQPGMVAAMISLSGTLAVDKCSNQNGLRVLEIHGEQDQNVPVKGGVGENSLAGVNFRSLEQTEQIMQGANAAYTVKIIPNAGHSIAELSKGIQAAESITLAEFISKFMSEKAK